ncbi:unnamed protein product, partial [Musa textilis]
GGAHEAPTGGTRGGTTPLAGYLPALVGGTSDNSATYGRPTPKARQRQVFAPPCYDGAAHGQGRAPVASPRSGHRRQYSKAARGN